MLWLHPHACRAFFWRTKWGHQVGGVGLRVHVHCRSSVLKDSECKPLTLLENLATSFGLHSASFTSWLCVCNQIFKHLVRSFLSNIYFSSSPEKFRATDLRDLLTDLSQSYNNLKKTWCLPVFSRSVFHLLVDNIWQTYQKVWSPTAPNTSPTTPPAWTREHMFCGCSLLKLIFERCGSFKGSFTKNSRQFIMMIVVMRYHNPWQISLT